MNSRINIFYLTFILVSLLKLSKTQEQLKPEICSSTHSTQKDLETLYGKVRGECYTIPLIYSATSPQINNQVEVLSWLSIPYAEPPINQNRFLDPKPVKNWQGIRDGIVAPIACLQPGRESSEDCLYLNIYMQSYSYSNRNNSLKPILVFIHGGGFVIGSSTDVDGSNIAAAADVIVVTINYRLSVNGFLHVPGTSVYGNQGLLDQTLALKWISDNALNFGGDRTKITISGESAGAWSVGYQLYNPVSWPYFRNAIMQSGGPTGKNNIAKLRNSNDASKMSQIFFYHLGCILPGSKEEQPDDKHYGIISWFNKQHVKCAQKKSSTEIADAYQKVTNYLQNEKQSYLPAFVPVIDNRVFSKSIPELTSENAFKQCDIMTGHASDEFALFLLVDAFNILDSNDFQSLFSELNNFNVQKLYASLLKGFRYYPIYPYKDTHIVSAVLAEYFTPNELEILNAKGLVQRLSQIFSDFEFTCQSYDIASIYSRQNNKAYVYELNYRTNKGFVPNEFLDFFGNSTHADEVPLVFGYALNKNSSTQEIRDLTQRVMFYWTNFVTYNDPSFIKDPNVIDWLPFASSVQDDYTNTGQRNEFMKEVFSMKSGYAKHHCKFWE